LKKGGFTFLVAQSIDPATFIRKVLILRAGGFCFSLFLF
jgi:hypothetical protein